MAAKVEHTVEFKDSFGVEPDAITSEPSAAQSLDYLRMDNEVSMEEASVLSAGAWAERDDTGHECA